MRKLLEARFNANKQVLATLQKNQEKFVSLPVMVDTVSEFKTLVDKTVELSSQLQSIPSKVAGNKELARIELAAISSKTSNLLKVYASINKDENLINFLVTSQSHLNHKMRNQQLLDYSKGVAQRVIALGEAIVPYGLTAEISEELNTEITEFEELIIEPRQTISERKTQNELLADAIADCSNILEDRIDPFMELFNGDKEFYMEYKSARMIVDAATRSNNEESTIE